ARTGRARRRAGQTRRRARRRRADHRLAARCGARVRGVPPDATRFAAARLTVLCHHRSMSIMARAAAATALLLIAACGSNRAAPPARGLAGALAAVSGTGAAVEAVAYTDLAALRVSGVIDARTHAIDPRWQVAATAGYRPLENVITRLPEVIGLDVTTADRAITIGDGGKAVRVDGGVDVAH